MYDLLQHIYVDAIIQKSRKTDESAALTSMVDRSEAKNVLLLADRGYEAYNNLAHIQEKGWSFLIRIKDSSAGIASGLNLPRSNTFDIPFHLKLTNKQTNEVKCLLLDKITTSASPLSAALIISRLSPESLTPRNSSICISALCGSPSPQQPAKPLLQILTTMRFLFRKLSTCTRCAGALKLPFVNWNIPWLYCIFIQKGGLHLPRSFAKLIMYNFCQIITQSVVIRQGKKKHAYKVSFSDAVHVCLRFFRGKISPPDVEALLMRYISPICPGRMLSRKFSPKSSVSFAYRVS